jgi:class 3 adenylate cyclase
VPVCAVCGYQATEPFKFCPACGAAAATRTSEQRKVVTVLFRDVVGSTALGESTDPEALRALLARYFERIKAIVERHRGEAFLDLAEVLQLNGQPAQAENALRAGLELFERKGDLVSGERARTRLEQVCSA